MGNSRLTRACGRDAATTAIYADYSPDDRRERDLVQRAFDGQGSNLGSNLSETKRTEMNQTRFPSG